VDSQAVVYDGTDYVSTLNKIGPSDNKCIRAGISAATSLFRLKKTQFDHLANSR
jgi:hypothetical protein